MSANCLIQSPLVDTKPSIISAGGTIASNNRKQEQDSTGTRELSSLSSSKPEMSGKVVQGADLKPYDMVINHLLSARHATPIDRLLQLVKQSFDLVHGLQQR
jgi:hypothetical protein